jgi:5-methylcytosine-specific restriction endonuclease McrA
MRKEEAYKAARRRAKARRRARKRGAQVVETIDPSRVFERDGFTCGLCGKRLAMGRSVPHPKAPTVDHIVPLANGGDHSYANVQAAHFICNSVKGNRGGPEQLRLVG